MILNVHHQQKRPQETVGRFRFGGSMQIGTIEGVTRICGKSQGFLGLPLRDGTRFCSVAGGEVPTMTSAWFPSDEELRALNAGAAIHVHIDGPMPAPMMLTVGPEPDPV